VTHGEEEPNIPHPSSIAARRGLVGPTPQAEGNALTANGDDGGVSWTSLPLIRDRLFSLPALPRVPHAARDVHRLRG
jgi:hypothetical protein